MVILLHDATVYFIMKYPQFYEICTVFNIIIKTHTKSRMQLSQFLILEGFNMYDLVHQIVTSGEKNYYFDIKK